MTRLFVLAAIATGLAVPTLAQAAGPSADSPDAGHSICVGAWNNESPTGRDGICIDLPGRTN